MPDREKVIKTYEDFVNGYECFCTSDDNEYEMHKAVLALLKEHETVTVHDPGAFCPKCGWMLFPDDHPQFCGNCGRVVKWE